CDHPHLRSSPTRRSSDLDLSTVRWAVPPARHPSPSGVQPPDGAWGRIGSDGESATDGSTEAFNPPVLLSTPPQGPIGAPESGLRSEEHTSELQSRENLVC